MGERRFLLVDSSALPDVFLKVLQAKELLASGSVSNISTAARQAGISRSAFYKYKDYVFDAETGREAITVIATLLALSLAGLCKACFLVFRQRVHRLLPSPSPGRKMVPRRWKLPCAPEPCR